VLSDLRQHALSQKAIFLKIDPDVPLGFGVPDSEEASPAPSGETVSAYLKREGWRFSREQIQFRNTLTLDLGPSEEELMAGMKQKTRYNVRLAGRKGVTVREGGPEDLHLLYTIYAETALRDSFTIRSWDYYQQAWGSFVNAGLAQPFIAEVESVPVAGLLAYRFGETAYYLFGMSRELHRKKMPNYLLQWEAIRWAKKSGCRIYDFWGAPEVFKRSDPMWGVYRFKRGFGPRIVRTLGAWDFPVRPFIYWLYGFLLPRILSVLRARGRKQTREALS
jgi:lipid II:glycine glycyltransferase (peptidoglycan interpeptide bridge formation enzyme)